MAEVSHDCGLPGLKMDKIIESKTNVFYTDYIKKIPQPLVTLLKYWRSLRFKEKPDYNFVRSLFSPVKVELAGKSSSVKIVMKLPDKDEEEKISFHKLSTPVDKSFTPNSSFTDTKKIKSFSFLKDNSHNNWVISKFRIHSSISDGDEGEESENSSSWTVLKHRKLSYPEVRQTPLNENAAIKDNTTSFMNAISCKNANPTTDNSPGVHTLMRQRPSGFESKVSGGGEEFTRDALKNNDRSLMKTRNNTTSQKSLFFFHQSTNQLNMIVESEESKKEEQRRIAGDVWEEIPEEDHTIPENLSTTELSEFNSHNMITPYRCRSILQFSTNQNSAMFKSGHINH